MGVELFADLGQGLTREMVWQEGQQRTAQEGQRRQEIGVAAAGAVFTQESISPPMVAVFHARPVAANELEPLLGTVLGRQGAGKVVVRFGGGLAGPFD